MTLRFIRRLAAPSVLCFLLSSYFPMAAFGQKSYTWQEIRDKFEAANPALHAGQLAIDEARALETTAYLRPNPDLSIAADQFETLNAHPYRPLGDTLNTAAITYLHERQHKRELRLESAKKSTAVATQQQADLKRTLEFSLRGAFVQALQAKAVSAIAKENLAEYDKSLGLNRERRKAGDIAQVDLDRLELQRVQFQADVLNSEVNLRTAKIQLLTLLNDRTPVEQFDVSGPFDFTEQLAPLDELRRIALETRPDLKAAVETVEKARADHRLAMANGSADPTFGFDVGRNPPLQGYMGVSVSIPLRIFDRNQGEKARTEINISRGGRLRDAAEAQVFSDVDSAYATLNNAVSLLRPYKSTYLRTATSVRDTINFAYQHGAASLLDFLQAQQDNRAIQVTYLNLIGAYLNAASQLNLAVGREVIQ